ncbi:hypothetical protein [Amycolatopsis sp. NPDC001319]|uniref:hypothetical protein n=1 Tax=unclassified Amycolatopsis TaxID=2618356 RepID=UPI0036BC8D3D
MIPIGDPRQDAGYCSGRRDLAGEVLAVLDEYRAPGPHDPVAALADIRAIVERETPREEPAPVGYAEHERVVMEEIDRRDEAEEWADKLAAALAPSDVLGEHSSTNNPWSNALDYAAGRAVPHGEPESYRDRIAREFGESDAFDDDHEALNERNPVDEEGSPSAIAAEELAALTPPRAGAPRCRCCADGSFTPNPFVPEVCGDGRLPESSPRRGCGHGQVAHGHVVEHQQDPCKSCVAGGICKRPTASDCIAVTHESVVEHQPAQDGEDDALAAIGTRVMDDWAREIEKLTAERDEARAQRDEAMANGAWHRDNHGACDEAVKGLAAERDQLRQYAETARHHQQKHAETHRELVNVRARIDTALAMINDGPWPLRADHLGRIVAVLRAAPVAKEGE